MSVGETDRNPVELLSEEFLNVGALLWKGEHREGADEFDSGQPNTYRPGLEFLAPVSLLAGRNTLLVRVSHSSDSHSLRLREGHPETARTRFDRARVLLDLPPTIRPAAGRIYVLDWLVFQVLRPQIEGPLFDRLFPVDPFVH